MKRNQRAKLIAATAAAITALLGTKPQITIAKPTAGTARTTGTAGGTAPATRLPKLEPLTVHPQSVPANIKTKPLLTIASGVQTTAKHKSKITVASPADQVSTSVMPDNSLGVNTTAVAQSGNVYTITGTVVSGNGANQFESFTQLNLASGDTVNFQPASTSVQNILVRVTGGSTSNINGAVNVLQVGDEFKSPGLYLLNRAGFVFGPNATLSMSSLTVASADMLTLNDGHRFISDAASGVSPVANGQPASLSFSSADTGPISFNGSSIPYNGAGLYNSGFDTLFVAAPAITVNGGQYTGGAMSLNSVKAGTIGFSTASGDIFEILTDTSGVTDRGTLAIANATLNSEFFSAIGSDINVAGSDLSSSTFALIASQTLSIAKSEVTGTGGVSASFSAPNITLSGTPASPTVVSVSTPGLQSIANTSANPVGLSVSANTFTVNGSVNISSPGVLLPVINSQSFTLNGQIAHLEIDPAQQSASLTTSQGSGSIQSDGSTGDQSVKGPTYVFNSNMGKIVGDNLFISVNAFSLAANEVAQFSPSSNIKAVVVRVTGGQPSRIEGYVDTSADVSFYFVNPAGVLLQGPSGVYFGQGFTSFAFAAVNSLAFAGGGSISDAAVPIPTNATGLPSQIAVTSTTDGSIRISNTLIGGNLLLAGRNLEVQGTSMLLEIPASAGNRGGLAATDFIAINNGIASIPSDYNSAPVLAGGATLGTLSIKDNSTITAISASAASGGYDGANNNYVYGGGYSAVHLVGGSVTIEDSVVTGPDESTYSNFNYFPPPASVIGLSIYAPAALSIIRSTVGANVGEPGQVVINAGAMLLRGEPQAAALVTSSGGVNQEAINYSFTPAALTINVDSADIVGNVSVISHALVPESDNGAPVLLPPGTINFTARTVILNGQSAAASFDSSNGLLNFAASSSSPEAGLTTDGTFGPALDLTGPNYAITPSAGEESGTNLYFSFKTFNIASGETATISGPPSTSNIIIRVTGGGPSNIFGTLKSTLNAPVYVLDPNGFSFQDGSHISSPGVICFATVEAMKFGDGFVLPCTATTTNALSQASPTSLQLSSSDSLSQFIGAGAVSSFGSGDVGTTTVSISQLAANGSLNASTTFAAPLLRGMTVIGREINIVNFDIQATGMLAMTTSGANAWVDVKGGTTVDNSAGAFTAGNISLFASAVGGGVGTNLVAARISSTDSTIGQSGGSVGLAASHSIIVSGQFATDYGGNAEEQSTSTASGIATGLTSFQPYASGNVAGNVVISAPSVELHDTVIDTQINLQSNGFGSTVGAGSIQIESTTLAVTPFTFIQGGGEISLIGSISIDGAPGSYSGGLFVPLSPPSVDSTFTTAKGLVANSQFGPGTEYVVDSSDGLVEGKNSYFSFKSLDGVGVIPAGDVLGDDDINGSTLFQFNLPQTVKDVFVRVTGGPVTLDGNFTFSQKVNLYVIDAQGISIHGATFTVGGSTVLAAGSNIKFSDGSVFPASGAVGKLSATASPVQVIYQMWFP